MPRRRGPRRTGADRGPFQSAHWRAIHRPTHCAGVEVVEEHPEAALPPLLALPLDNPAQLGARLHLLRHREELCGHPGPHGLPVLPPALHSHCQPLLPPRVAGRAAAVHPGSDPRVLWDGELLHQRCVVGPAPDAGGASVFLRGGLPAHRPPGQLPSSPGLLRLHPGAGQRVPHVDDDGHRGAVAVQQPRHSHRERRLPDLRAPGRLRPEQDFHPRVLPAAGLPLPPVLCL
mmetsp:Transcript_6711/g.18955  ORF Transcript_6711/g.18955 Transcript_6711/m.18955 type:complete len:231 (-) Transcript_6711:1616-2308(-)